MKIDSIERICRECWKENKVIIPLWKYNKITNIIEYHNHKLEQQIKVKEG